MHLIIVFFTYLPIQGTHLRILLKFDNDAPLPAKNDYFDKLFCPTMLAPEILWSKGGKGIPRNELRAMKEICELLSFILQLKKPSEEEQATANKRGCPWWLYVWHLNFH